MRRNYETSAPRKEQGASAQPEFIERIIDQGQEYDVYRDRDTGKSYGVAVEAVVTQLDQAELPYEPQTTVMPAMARIEQTVHEQVDLVPDGVFYQSAQDHAEQQPRAAFVDRQRDLTIEDIAALRIALDETEKDIVSAEAAAAAAAERERIAAAAAAEKARAAAAEAAETKRLADEAARRKKVRSGLAQLVEDIKAGTADEGETTDASKAAAGVDLGDMTFSGRDSKYFNQALHDLQNEKSVPKDAGAWMGHRVAALKREDDMKSARVDAIHDVVHGSMDAAEPVTAENPIIDEPIALVAPTSASESVNAFDETVAVSAPKPTVTPTGNGARFIPVNPAPTTPSDEDIAPSLESNGKSDNTAAAGTVSQPNRLKVLAKKLGGERPVRRAVALSAISAVVAAGVVGAKNFNSSPQASELVGECFSDNNEATPLMSGALSTEADVIWTAPGADSKPFTMPGSVKDSDSGKKRHIKLGVEAAPIQATICELDSSEKAAIEVTGDTVLVHADRLTFQAQSPVGENAAGDAGWEPLNLDALIDKVDAKAITDDVSTRMLAASKDGRNVQRGALDSVEQAYALIEGEKIDKKTTKELNKTAMKLLKQHLKSQTETLFPNKEMEVVVNGSLPKIDFDDVEPKDAEKHKAIDVGHDVKVTMKNVDVESVKLEAAKKE